MPRHRHIETFMILAFLCLQLLDFAATAIGFALGAQEANPLVAAFVDLGATPLSGLAASKILAFGFAVFCVQVGRVRVIQWLNFWLAGLLSWNLAIISRLG